MPDDRNLDWLRPWFNGRVEKWWVSTKLAYEVYPSLVELPVMQVSQAIIDLLGQQRAAGVRIEPVDSKYWTYSREVWERIIADDETSKMMGWPDRMDCDDFALRFKSNGSIWYNATAVGIVKDDSAGHAYNVIVFADGKAKLFEPQQDRFVDLDEPVTIATTGTGKYSLTSGLILI